MVPPSPIHVYAVAIGLGLFTLLATGACSNSSSLGGGGYDSRDCFHHDDVPGREVVKFHLTNVGSETIYTDNHCGNDFDVIIDGVRHVASLGAFMASCQQAEKLHWVPCCDCTSFGSPVLPGQSWDLYWEGLIYDAFTSEDECYSLSDSLPCWAPKQAPHRLMTFAPSVFRTTNYGAAFTNLHDPIEVTKDFVYGQDSTVELAVQ